MSTAEVFCHFIFLNSEAFDPNWYAVDINGHKKLQMFVSRLGGFDSS